MDQRLQDALKRAKSLLGDLPKAPELTVAERLDKVVAEAKAYLETNPDIASDVEIEVYFCKDGFEVCFESEG